MKNKTLTSLMIASACVAAAATNAEAGHRGHEAAHIVGATGGLLHGVADLTRAITGQPAVVPVAPAVVATPVATPVVAPVAAPVVATPVATPVVAPAVVAPVATPVVAPAPAVVATPTVVTPAPVVAPAVVPVPVVRPVRRRYLPPRVRYYRHGHCY